MKPSSLQSQRPEKEHAIQEFPVRMLKDCIIYTYLSGSLALQNDERLEGRGRCSLYTLSRQFFVYTNFDRSSP